MAKGDNKSSFGSSMEELRVFDWSELADFDTIGIWPKAVKILIGIIIFALCIAAGVWFHVRDLQIEMVNVQNRETELLNDFNSKANLAVNLDLYRLQMQQMEDSFDELLKALPGETDIPELLVDIDRIGRASGLEFKVFEPRIDVPQDFYMEKPINIEVVGTYHDLATFISGVASLDRIVTLHDYTILPAGNGLLEMKIQAKTYRYISPDE
jgi:type IV pilus assembly protein PilO